MGKIIAVAAAVLLVIVAVVVVAVSMASGSKVDVEDLAQQVQASIERDFATNPAAAGLEITEPLALIHVDGKQYRGVLEVTQSGMRLSLPVNVTFDGDKFLWQVN